VVKGERGFSLLELLIVTAILGMVAGAVFGVYQVSQQIYTRATSLEDAQLGVRAGLDRMAGEFRLIGAYLSGAIGAPAAISAISTASPVSITFLADIDADGAGTTTTTAISVKGVTAVVVDGSSATFNTYTTASLNDYLYIANGAWREVKQVSSVVTATNTITLATGLTNKSYPTGSMVRSIETMKYTFNDASAGTNPSTITRKVGGGDDEVIVENVTGLTLTYYQSDGTTTTTTASDIREIEIKLTTKGSDGSLRTMTSRVKPRSLDIQPQ